MTTGANVTVAVVDTGIAYDHPDLAPNVWTNPADPTNGIDDDGNGFVDDVHGADFMDEDSQPGGRRRPRQPRRRHHRRQGQQRHRRSRA